MKKQYHLIVLLFPLLALGQSADQNYVKTTTYRAPEAGDPQTNVTYFDGLGRPIQQVEQKQSGSGMDMVTPITYDAYGRQVKDYLPYPTIDASGNYKPDAVTGVLNYYRSDPSNSYTLVEGTDFPYSEKFFEPSPLNRILKQSAPGDDWQGIPNSNADHTIKIEYASNVENEVLRYYVNTFWHAPEGLYGEPLYLQGFYEAGMLYKTITRDENWTSGRDHTTEEFKDKEGRLILKRNYDSNEAHDTYYVYNRFGELTHVIPPMGNIYNLAGLCYLYNYDDRGRLAFKKLPGVQWQLFLYDKQNRQVGTGPVLSPYGTGQLGWMVTRYDVFGRVIATGWLKGEVNLTIRKSYQEQINGGGNPLQFNEQQLLSENHYDDYNFAWFGEFATTILDQPVYYNATQQPKGLLTGTRIRALTSEGSTNFITNYHAYDEKGRIIRTYKWNYFGSGYTHTDFRYDFTGRVLEKFTSHRRDPSTSGVDFTEIFTYTPENRLLQHTHQIKEQELEVITENEYNELGQLSQKNVGGQIDDPLQRVNYNYTIRGWLKGINLPNGGRPTFPTDLFHFKLSYNTLSTTPTEGVERLFNGNISETTWWTNSDSKIRSYGYRYDALNRLRDAYYQKGGENTNSYNESLKYDKNGNITLLNRTGSMDPDGGVPVIDIDALSYRYDPIRSNLLLNVTDYSYNPQGFHGDPDPDSDSFTYDELGNLISDKNKNIEKITYNHMNLPLIITFGDGHKINYIYDGTGQKLAKKVTESGNETLTDYLDGFQYKNSELQFFPTAEGYVNHTKGKYNYIYNYTDHLGNVRLSYTKDPVDGLTKIVEENNYYPFGLKHSGYNNDTKAFVYENEMVTLQDIAGNNPNQYKYNGKEFQDELGLNLYDYGARNYDPAIGRWMNMDPLAEASRRWSPYSYCYNNPMVFVDPDGMLATPPDWYLDARTGKVLGQDGASTNNVRVIYKSDWENTVASNGGSISAQATSELQSMSGAVSVNSGRIQSDVNTINSQTINDQSKERQVLIGLSVDESGDYPTAELTSTIGPEGPGGGELDTGISNSYADQKKTQLTASSFEDTKLKPIAQAHTHNKVTGKNVVNVATTSPKDKESSMSQGITRYAIDSWTGNTSAGNAIHSVTGGGVQTNNVGTTQNFNIGQDALDKHIGN